MIIPLILIIIQLLLDVIEGIKEKKYSESLEKYSGDILLVDFSYDDEKTHYCKI